MHPYPEHHSSVISAVAWMCARAESCVWVLCWTLGSQGQHSVWGAVLQAFGVCQASTALGFWDAGAACFPSALRYERDKSCF